MYLLYTYKILQHEINFHVVMCQFIPMSTAGLPTGIGGDGLLTYDLIMTLYCHVFETLNFGFFRGCHYDTPPSVHCSLFKFLAFCFFSVDN